MHAEVSFVEGGKRSALKLDSKCLLSSVKSKCLLSRTFVQNLTGTVQGPSQNPIVEAERHLNKKKLKSDWIHYLLHHRKLLKVSTTCTKLLGLYACCAH